MRGAFGQFWARELAKSPELKSAYADVGKSYSAQRSFRANWAAKEFEACSAQRIREESVETRAGLKARHMSAGRIFVEEGGDLIRNRRGKKREEWRKETSRSSP